MYIHGTCGRLFSLLLKLTVNTLDRLNLLYILYLAIKRITTRAQLNHSNESYKNHLDLYYRSCSSLSYHITTCSMTGDHHRSNNNLISDDNDAEKIAVEEHNLTGNQPSSSSANNNIIYNTSTPLEPLSSGKIFKRSCKYLMTNIPIII